MKIKPKSVEAHSKLLLLFIVFIALGLACVRRASNSLTNFHFTVNLTCLIFLSALASFVPHAMLFRKQLTFFYDIICGRNIVYMYKEARLNKTAATCINCQHNEAIRSLENLRIKSELIVSGSLVKKSQ